MELQDARQAAALEEIVVASAQQQGIEGKTERRQAVNGA